MTTLVHKMPPVTETKSINNHVTQTRGAALGAEIMHLDQSLRESQRLIGLIVARKGQTNIGCCNVRTMALRQQEQHK